MLVIHYPTAFRALDRFIDGFNEKVGKSTLRLGTGAVLTAKEIIRIYGVALLKAAGLQDMNFTDALPGLQTNNRQLARLVKCSARSVQRHIRRLLTAGIIIRKIFHGSNANYELWINPDILLIRERMTVESTGKQLNECLENARQTELRTCDASGIRTKCPHTYSGNKSYKNNIISTVEKASDLTGDAGEFVPSEATEEAGEFVSRAAPPGHRNVRPGTARDNSLSKQLCADLLWLMARNLLYRDTDLTDRQVLTAKRLVYKLYEPVPEDQLSRAHSQYVERIVLVNKYVRKDPGKRFVPLPYLYFDTNNPRGFVGTKKWFFDDQRRKQEVKNELTVSRLIRSYLKNETTRLQSRLQLFRACENTIGKLKVPALLHRFYAAVLDPQTYRNLTQN